MSGGILLQLVFPCLDHYEGQSDPTRAGRERRRQGLQVLGTTNSVVLLHPLLASLADGMCFVNASNEIILRVLPMPGASTNKPPRKGVGECLCSRLVTVFVYLKRC